MTNPKTGEVLSMSGKKITFKNGKYEVDRNDLLAFEPTIEWNIKLMHKIAGMMSGELFNVRLEGSGMIAITSHYEPLTLLVTPDQPVYTDPNATVEW